MKPSIQTFTTSNGLPLTTHRIIEFDTCRAGKSEIVPYVAPWEWPRIQQLLDDVLSLSTKRQTTDSNDWKLARDAYAKELYPYLPNGKGELRAIRNNAKKYIQKARRKIPSEAREVIRPYYLQLEGLVVAAAQKLAVIICQPNSRNWDPRAYRLYQELQSNLGQLRRIHFVTLTFSGSPTYEQIGKLLKGFTGNQLYRGGFGSFAVVAYHPEPDKPGRMHVHLLIWSKHPRTAQAEKTAIKGIMAAVGRSRRGIGFTDYRPVTGASEILKVSAYMAWNYSQTLRNKKGKDSPIPKGARVIRPPQNCLPGQKWTSVGKTSLVTPSTTAWRQAVSRYAEACGRSSEGDRRWTWRERRHVRQYLEPDAWRECSVTGLDGYTYRIRKSDTDYLGNQIYRLESENGRSFNLIEDALIKLAQLQITPGALTKNESLDFTTGKTANWLEMLGMYAFMSKLFHFEQASDV